MHHGVMAYSLYLSVLILFVPFKFIDACLLFSHLLQLPTDVSYEV